jgi:hypothetical protein
MRVVVVFCERGVGAFGDEKSIHTVRGGLGAGADEKSARHTTPSTQK